MDARAIIADLIGKPFADGARGPDAFDCWGLTMAAMLRFDYRLPEYHIGAFESATIDGKINEQRHVWHEIAIPERGCVVVMRFGERNLINHVGTYLGQGLMLHVREKTGTVVERMNTPVFTSLIQGYYLPPENYKI